MIKSLIDAEIIGDKVYNAFVQKRLVEVKKRFFDPIKKIQLLTGLKSRRAKPKALSAVKEIDSPSEALKYPISIVPLINFILNESGATEVVPPRDSLFHWILNTMSLMKSLKMKETYGKWFDQIMKVTMPCEAERYQSLEYIIDS